jgi:hypothetical protein
MHGGDSLLNGDDKVNQGNADQGVFFDDAWLMRAQQLNSGNFNGASANWMRIASPIGAFWTRATRHSPALRALRTHFGVGRFYPLAF